MRLITRRVWECLTPYTQGYLLYMQAEWPKSELKGIRCPYAEGTKEYREFQQGEQEAMLEAQDGDD